MTEQTDAAMALLAAVARAFYDDQAICLVDFLLRHAFLRDGNGMGKRHFSLSTKQVRKTLAFLQGEHLVALEQVSGIVETTTTTTTTTTDKSTQTRTYRRRKTAAFWYLDWNRAVHAVRLRLHLMKQRLEKDLLDTWRVSHYQCPGYKTEACNGNYTEIEVQSMVLEDDGRFFCRECHNRHQYDPNVLPEQYTLQLVDTTKDRLRTDGCLKRFNAQMRSEKDVEGKLLRPGIWDLLQRVRVATDQERRPVSSNLPSENGAEQYLAEDMMTTTFPEEAADEFSGLVYFQHPISGQRVALEIEKQAGPAAAYRARRGLRTISAGEKQLLHAAMRVGLSSSSSSSGTPTNTTTTNTSASKPPSSAVAPPALPRPTKLACRQATPEFLRNNLPWKSLPPPPPPPLPPRHQSDDEALDVVERTRRLSIETFTFLLDETDATSSGGMTIRPLLAAKEEHDENNTPASSLGFIESFQTELDRQKWLPLGREKVSPTKKERQASGSSCASVCWEEG